MRVLFVFDSLSPYAGGSQLSVITWFNNLKKHGITVKLLTDQHISSAGLKLDKKDLIINPSIQLGEIFAKFSFSPLLFNDTKKAIAQFNPDIVHIHEQLLVSYQILRFAKKNNYLILTSLHGDPYKFKVRLFPLSLLIHKGSFINQLLRKFQYYMLKNSDYITVPTKYYQRLLQREIHNKIITIPYPVSSFFYKNSHISSRPVNKLIVVSRLAGEKNIDVLIETMQYLKNRFTLTICGEGIDKKYFEDKVAQLNLKGCIIFIGWLERKEVPILIKKHHLFLSASNFETFGITYIEALACGLPCVVYDYPVSREVIPNEMAVFVKDLKPKTWAQELIKIQDHQSIYNKLKEHIKKNYEKIVRYREEQSTNKLVELYQQLTHNTK